MFADIDHASAFASAAVELGYGAEINEVEDRDARWDVICTKTMAIDGARITAAEIALSELATTYDGQSDGWGWWNGD